jgi:cytidyltransferase-like protein
MASIDYPDLPAIREKHRDQKIVFCSGTFDLPHAGHVRFFETANSLGDILVVAVGKDEDIRRNKGSNRPILDERVRLKIVDSFKPVHYTFLNRSPAEGADWIEPIREILELLRPDLYVVNYDGGSLERRQEVADAVGVPLKVLQLDRNHPDQFDGISTSDIIKKILEGER